MVWDATQMTLDEAFGIADKTARAIRKLTLSARDKSVAGPISRSLLIDLMSRLQEAIDRWDQVVVIPGIAQEIRDQKGDQTLDPATDFAAMDTQATALRDWIFDNFPKDGGSGAWLFQSVDAQGVRIDLTFNAAQRAAFVTQADLFLATIG